MNKENFNIHHTKKEAINGDIIFASKESISLLDKRITELESELVSTTKAMGESARHDNDLPENYDFRDLRFKATDILPRRINELKGRKKKLFEFPIVSENINFINLGDKFTVEMYFSGESTPETETFELVGPLEIELNQNFKSDLDKIEDFQKISYLSPIGMAVWGVSKEKGTEFTYKVETNTVRCVLV